jgi:hypothetical protein
VGKKYRTPSFWHNTTPAERHVPMTWLPLDASRTSITPVAKMQNAKGKKKNALRFENRRTQ